MKQYYLLFLSLFFSSTLFAQQIHHVKWDASGLNNGSSWQDAFIDLQSAIAQSNYGDQIWVTDGTYKPTTTNDQHLSFSLKNGVQFYGGFQGNETELNQRDFTFYKSILSGNIGLEEDSTDNSHHVLYAIGTDSSTLLDGFVITEGYAVTDTNPASSFFNRGGGLLLRVNSENTNTNPTLKNNIFTKNVALYAGGGICCSGTENGSASPKISNCSFIENHCVVLGGGGLYKTGYGPSISPFKIDSCIFEENVAGRGGAIYLEKISGENHIISHNSFIKNTSTTGADAIDYRSYDLHANISIHNSIFIKKRKTTTSGNGGLLALGVRNQSFSYDYHFEIDNCTFESEDTTGQGLGSMVSIYDWEQGTELNHINLVFKNSTLKNHPTNKKHAKIFLFTGKHNTITGLIENCIFEGASPITSLYKNQNAIASSTSDFGQIELTVNNCIFNNSNRVFNFRAVNSNSLEGDHIVCNLNNCTLYNTGVPSFYRIWNPNLSYIQELNISNSIIWTDTTVSELFANYYAPLDSVVTMEGYTISNSLLRSTDCLVNGIDVCGEGMLFATDPLFRDTANGDFRLKACSPAINAGDNILAASNPFDFEGNTRIQEGIIDLGAFEQLSVPDLNIVVTQATSTTIGTGSILLDSISGGTAPYDILWNTGNTSNVLSGLLPGPYTVTITDALGCSRTDTITVDFLSGTSNLSLHENIQLYPSPADRHLQINIETANIQTMCLQVRNTLGHLLFETTVEQDELISYDTQKLPSGFYFCSLIVEGRPIAGKKFIVQH